MAWTAPTDYFSSAQTGYNALFYLGVQTSPDSYNLVCEIRSIKTNDFTIPEVNVTHLNSPNATEEMIPGLIKPGTIEVTANFIGSSLPVSGAIAQVPPASSPTENSIPELGQNQTLVFWKVVAPINRNTNTYTVSGTGYLAKFEVGPFENNKAVDLAFGIQITGTITYATT